MHQIIYKMQIMCWLRINMVNKYIGGNYEEIL